MAWFFLRSATRSVRVGALIATVLLLVGACGGSDPEIEEAADQAEVSTDDQSEPDPTPTSAVVIPTSTPLPTPTALPRPSPVPLEEPTPSTVLLTTAFTNSSKVTTVGIDEVFFGMTAEEAAEAASTEWIGEPSTGTNCYRVTPSTGPDRVTLWVVDGRIERLDIEHPDIRTPSKLGVGNSLAELRSQLGDRLTIESADDGSRTATFTPTDVGDRDFRIIFELVDDRVVSYRSGRIGIVQRAADGC